VIDPAQARRTAHEILSEPRFQVRRRHHGSNWLQRSLGWVGDRILGALRWLHVTQALDWIGDRIAGAFDWLARHLPGGSYTAWAVVALLVVGVAAILARVLARRAVGDPGRRTGAAAALERLDPARLERRADEAEQAGDYALAIRLRYLAGLLRLDRAEVIDFRESLTAGAVARRVRSRDFTAVARGFEAVAYGGKDAAPEDAAAAREGWSRVLAEVRR
jgi:Domain of unknown function (DUF4129)